MFLYIMLAYLMLHAVLFHVACLYNACLSLFLYFALEFCIVIICTNAFCFHALSLGYFDIVCLLQFIILYLAQCFYSVGFLSFIFTLILFMKGICTVWRNSA